MKISSSHYEAFLCTNEFLDQVGSLLNRNLKEIQSFLGETALELMNHAKEISTLTAARKLETTQMMADTHLSPTETMERSIAENQKGVDDIFERAMAGDLSIESTKDEAALAQKRREGSKFSKNVEAIHQLEDDLTKLFFDLAGALSEEDVMHQILRNIVDNHISFHQLFRSLPEELAQATPLNDLARNLSGLLSGLKKTCKSTEETALFSQVFSKVNLQLSGIKGIESVAEVSEIINVRLCYHRFLTLQLNTIREGYTRIIDNAMNTVFQINSSQDHSKKHANSIMLKQADAGFRNQSLGDFEAHETAFLQGIETKSRALREFSLPSEIMSQMDAKMGDHLMAMMGSLSVGDVIAQRINNIITINQALEKINSHMLEDPLNRLDPHKVDQMIQNCLRYILRQFVSIEERTIFGEIFGDPQQFAA